MTTGFGGPVSEPGGPLRDARRREPGDGRGEDAAGRPTRRELSSQPRPITKLTVQDEACVVGGFDG
jgi:hypothetical protein